MRVLVGMDKGKETKQSIVGKMVAVHFMRSFSWFSSLPEGKCWNNVINYMSCLLQSLFTNHPFTEHSVNIVTESLMETKNKPIKSRVMFHSLNPCYQSYTPGNFFCGDISW
jgi:hypothetical protein